MSSVILASIARRMISQARTAVRPVGAGLAVACLGLAQPTPSLAADEPANKAAALPADPECLTISQASAATYTISNTACGEQSVIASIELADAGNLARCFVKKIRTQISIASEGSAPIVNYQCIEGAQGCTVEIVRDMFPECHAG
ncbi:MAG: hypothetical protein J0H65_07560 [Rhizobiales bacterium]|nr:hypothetical protein [Hyphomicrobiales bacterium]